jgi:hypothetical protein
MGLPQLLADALRDFERADTVDRPGQTPRVEDVLAIEQNLEKLKDRSRTLFEDMERKVAAGERPEGLDETIDSLLETEEEFKREFLPHLELARRRKTAVISYPGAKASASAASLLDRWIDAILGGLMVLRDLRWDLMALRAETEAPGDSPVFDNPQDLLKYLKTNAQ